MKKLASDDRLAEDIFFIQYFQFFMTKDCCVIYLKKINKKPKHEHLFGFLLLFSCTYNLLIMYFRFGLDV